MFFGRIAVAEKYNSVLEKYPDFEVVIGMEVHAQLSTTSKIFCSCANQISKEPNTNICPICCGHPGVLPVLNSKVVEYAIMAGLATRSTINALSEFDRKHYFYPDLPKGYQITQNDKPICTDGTVVILLPDGKEKIIRLMRIHIEEDAGKSIHASDYETFVDLNRAGTPLLEMVSHPDISSSYEAKAYLKALRLIVQYLGICSGNMEEGAFRADTNISVRRKGESRLGTKVELKNINSFKFIGDAIEYEIERQINCLLSNETIYQETRLWDTAQGITKIMRTKEGQADYRYFREPDLAILQVDEERIAAVRSAMPELPYEKRKRLCVAYGLSLYEAEILLDDKALADYYEQAMKYKAHKSLINWVLRDVLGYVNEHKILLQDLAVTPERLADLVVLLEKGAINNQGAKRVFELIIERDQDPEVIVKQEGLQQIGSADELSGIVEQIIAENPENVAQYKAGKDRLFGFFVGQVMSKTKGRGNPQVIQDLLKKHLQ